MKRFFGRKAPPSPEVPLVQPAREAAKATASTAPTGTLATASLPTSEHGPEIDIGAQTKLIQQIRQAQRAPTRSRSNEHLVRTGSMSAVAADAVDHVVDHAPDEVLLTGTDSHAPARTVVPMHPAGRPGPRTVAPEPKEPEEVGGTAASSANVATSPPVRLQFKGQPQRVESFDELCAGLGRPWRGMLSGIVASDLSKACVPLDLSCAEVALLVTEDMLNNAHYGSVRRTIEQNWLYRVRHVFVAPAAVVQEVHQRCLSEVGHAELRSIEEKNRLVTVYDDIVAAAIEAKASDIHFVTEHERGVVRLRVYGVYRPWLELDPRLILDALSAAFGSRIKTSTNSKEQFSAEVSVNFMTSQRIDGRQWDGRYNGRPHATGYKGVLRLLESAVRRDSIPTFNGLGYNASHEQMLTTAMQRKWGLLLISGPTGSGKSTTLRTCMVHVPGAESLARYTVESPVEYEMPGIVQFSVPVDVNQDSEEISRMFTALLRDVVRMDPDMLMVGEIRDRETAKLLVEFTTSGHRSASSLHGGGCIDVLSRACGPEIGIPSETLGGAKFLNASIYQRLLPVLCPHCRIRATDAAMGLSQAKQDVLRSRYRLDPGTMFVANPKGCVHCKPSVSGLAANGTKGVVAAAEILMPDAGMRELIAARDWTGLERAWRGLRRTDFSNEDMLGKTAFEHGLWLASQGRVSVLDLEAEFEAVDDFEVFDLAPGAVA